MAATPPGIRLRGRTHKIALTAHILGSVGWFGIAAFVTFCAFGASATNDEALADGLLRTAETAPWLSIPVGLLAVATGALLSLGTKWGLVRHWWVVAKIVIAILVIVTDALVLAHFARDAIAAGDPRKLYGPAIAHTIALTVATVVSVLKPRGRTPWNRTREPERIGPS